jgi:hypothetical protein
MADLSTIKPVERDVAILDPENDAPIGLTISLMSIDDERMKAAKRHINDRAIQLERRGKTFMSEDIDNNLITLAFKACTGWRWHEDHEGVMGSWNGEQLEWNKANFTTVMGLAWIEKQVTRAISDDTSFFKRSKPT